MEVVTEIKEFIETMFRSFLGFWSPILRRSNDSSSTAKKYLIALIEFAVSFFEEKVSCAPTQYKVDLRPSPFYLSFQDYNVTNTNLVRAPNA